MSETVVKFEHVSMEFPGVLANDDVSLEIKKGEVFALVGENGAGKSTLMNILYGINTPTNGEVYVKGRRIEHFSPKAAIERGVGMVHQHFMLVPSFTVAQNIVLSREPRRLGVFFDNAGAERETRGLVEEYGLEVDPAATVRDISVGLQQRVEILKTLYRGADILIRLHAGSMDNSGVYGALSTCMTAQNPYNAGLHDKSYNLSKKIVDTVCGTTGTKNRGVQETDSSSDINWCEIPVCVFEMGFLSNPDEDTWLQDDGYQGKIASGIAGAVDAYFAEGN